MEVPHKLCCFFLRSSVLVTMREPQILAHARCRVKEGKENYMEREREREREREAEGKRSMPSHIKGKMNLLCY